MNRRRVLLETSWNVKINGKTKAAITIRINRNIVECKEWYYKGHWSYEGVLIETSWNVKYDIWIEKGYVRTVLIETSWNVKQSPYVTDRYQA